MYRKKGFTLIELLIVIAIIAILLSIVVPALQNAKEQAKFAVCKTNLHQYGLGFQMYLSEYKEYFPDPFYWLFSEEQFNDFYNSGYNAPWINNKMGWPEGMFWPYVSARNCHMCPTFYGLSVQTGNWHPNYDPDVDGPVDPQYSYGMNAYLGSLRPNDEAARKLSGVERLPESIFCFTEQDPYPKSGLSYAGMNDNFMVIRPWYPGIERPDVFGTYHNLNTSSDLDEGKCNAVFLDGHVEPVHVGLENADDGFYKYALPKKKPHSIYGPRIWP